MTEPLAVVHWVDHHGEDHSKKCFTQSELERCTWFVGSRNYLSWTCIVSGDVSIPLRPPERHIRAV